MEMLNNILPHSRLSERTGATSLSGGAFAPHDHDLARLGPCFPLAPTYAHPSAADYLERHRVVAFRTDHRLTRAYDVLRNQIVNQNFDFAADVLAVTAPGPACGTSTTALNLAFSFARLAAGPVALVDANHASSAAADLLGLPVPEDLPGGTPRGQHVLVEAEDVSINLLRPAFLRPGAATIGPAGLDESIEHLRHALKPAIVILDLPPLLHCDLTAQMVTRADYSVLVLAANQTSRSEFEVARTFFHPDHKLQVVLNRAARHGL